MTRPSRIVKLRREGYRLWKISEMTGQTINDVMEVLVDCGVLDGRLIEAVIARESKPTLAEVKSMRCQLTALRKHANITRRKRQHCGPNRE